MFYTNPLKLGNSILATIITSEFSYYTLVSSRYIMYLKLCLPYGIYYASFDHNAICAGKLSDQITYIPLFNRSSLEDGVSPVSPLSQHRAKPENSTKISHGQ